MKNLMVAHKSPMNRFQDPPPNTLRDQMMIKDETNESWFPI